jgi:hypothetical protein
MPDVNNAWASAITLTGTSGSGSGDLFGATVETGEPDLDPAGVPGTLWYVFTPSAPGVLNFSASGYGIEVELLIGDTLVELSQQDVGSGSVSAGVADGVPIYIRVYPQSTLSSTAPFTYAWSFAANVNDLTVTLVSDSPTSPGTVVVHVGNLAQGDIVNFFIDHDATPALTDTVPVEDSDGINVGFVWYVPLEEQLLYIGVPVNEAYAKGTHTLQVDSSSGRSSIINFEVEGDPDDVLLDPADTTPSAPGVTQWVFQDPVPGGESYAWEINPLTTSSPYPELTITEAHTTAPDGQPIEWEGNKKAVQWQLTGTLLTQTQLEAFQRFAALDHRVWLIDHWGRGWLVTIEELSAEPQVKGSSEGYPWIHNWTMSLLIWRGPVDLT